MNPVQWAMDNKLTAFLAVACLALAITVTVQNWPEGMQSSAPDPYGQSLRFNQGGSDAHTRSGDAGNYQKGQEGFLGGRSQDNPAFFSVSEELRSDQRAAAAEGMRGGAGIMTERQLGAQLGR